MKKFSVTSRERAAAVVITLGQAKIICCRYITDLMLKRSSVAAHKQRKNQNKQRKQTNKIIDLQSVTFLKRLVRFDNSNKPNIKILRIELYDIRLSVRGT